MKTIILNMTHIQSLIARIIITAILMVWACNPTLSAASDIEQSYCSGYGKEKADFFWGNTTNSHLSAAIKLDRQMLNGSEIVALKFYLDPAPKMNDCMIFIKKNLDREENLYEQEFSPEAGWNIVWLDYPFGISNLEEVYIGYEMTCNGETIGAAYNAPTEAPSEADRVRDGRGDWGSLSDITGRPSQLSLAAILTGGDYSTLPQTGIAVSPDALPSLVKADEPFDLSATVMNTGVQTLHGLSMTYTVDGDIPGETVYITDRMMNCGSQLVTIPVTVSQGRHKVDVTVTREGGSTTDDFQTFSFAVDAYPRAYPKLPLVEVFTSQYCTNCPVGEENLEKVLHAYNSPVTRISHHSGFAPDNFTIPQSETLAESFGILSAPSMMLDRAPAMAGGQSALVFNPGYANLSHFEGYKNQNTLIGIQTQAVYHTPDHLLTVKTTVEKDESFAVDNLMLHVIVCEDAVEDFQLIPGSAIPSYTHSHAVRAFLTPVDGQPVVFDADGNAVVEFSTELPASKTGTSGNLVYPVADNLNVVTFLAHNNLAASDFKVANSSTSIPEISEESGIATISADASTALAYIAPDGSVTPASDLIVIDIHNLNGTRVATLRDGASLKLAPGIYIISSPEGLSQKIAVTR